MPGRLASRSKNSSQRKCRLRPQRLSSILESPGDLTMSFYDRLMAETSKDRDAFLAIPIVQHAIRNGAPRGLYLDFLTEAYHHVKHTFPLLALAASRTSDERYQDALVEYMEEERGHEKWILDDIRAVGGDPDAIRTGTPGVPCQIMVGYAYFALEHLSPYPILGSTPFLEGCYA